MKKIKRAKEKKLFNLSCEGKIRHPTLRAATFVAKKKNKGEKIHPYLCVNCHFYHVGH